MSGIITAIQKVIDDGDTYLSLRNMNIIDENLQEICEILMNCKTITSIGLSRNKITTLKSITFPPCVKNLFLGSNKITALDGFVAPNDLQAFELVLI